MKKNFVNICMLSICSIMLFGCSNKQNEKQIEAEMLTEVQSETENESTEEDTIEEIIDLSDTFDGMNGCAVLYNPLENKYSLYNEEMAKREVSPYSTFKIVSTLAGLYNDIIKDEMSTMNYMETKYPNEDWNENLNLQEAFQTSCIWYFRQIIDEIGEDEIETELLKLEYGNCDVSEWEGSNINPYEELNGFWLNSSLKISPIEQVEVLTRIFEGESIYSSEDIEILKKVMLIEDDGERKIYGKTGSGSNGEAWFVGFVESGQQRNYFAIYLNDDLEKQMISGNIAKEIAQKIVK